MDKTKKILSIIASAFGGNYYYELVEFEGFRKELHDIDNIPDASLDKINLSKDMANVYLDTNRSFKKIKQELCNG